MTDTTAAHQPLGVLKLLSETVSLFFRNILWFSLLIILYILPIAFFWMGTFFTYNQLFVGFIIILVIVFFVIVFTGLFLGLGALSVYDIRLGRPIRFGFYLSAAWRNLIPIMICGIIACVLVGLGVIALVVPGLWLYAVFSVLTPVIVVEGCGFGGFRRSIELTKGYRWPIVGGFIISSVCANAIAFALALVVNSTLILVMDPIIATVASEAVTTITRLIMSIFPYVIYPALIYARLREIKEGVTANRTAEVLA